MNLWSHHLGNFWSVAQHFGSPTILVHRDPNGKKLYFLKYTFVTGKIVKLDWGICWAQFDAPLHLYGKSKFHTPINTI